MSPPELKELTPCLYSCKMDIASEELENARIHRLRNCIPRDIDLLRIIYLFNKKSFAKLVPADKRFHGAEAAEEILDFAVLENFLGRA
jgi:hypothetical protein